MIDTIQNQRILMMLLMNLMIKRTREAHSGSLEKGRILALRQEVIEMMSQIRGTKKLQILSYIVHYSCFLSSMLLFSTFYCIQSKWRCLGRLNTACIIRHD